MRGSGRLGLAALAAGRGEVLGAEGRRVLGVEIEPAALARRRQQLGLLRRALLAGRSFRGQARSRNSGPRRFGFPRVRRGPSGGCRVSGFELGPPTR